jgi:hypothetical protein
MTENKESEWKYGVHGLDLPVIGEDIYAADHQSCETKTNEKRPLKLAQKSGHLLNEIDVFIFLGSCAPYHFDREKVACNCLANVYRDTAQEDCHQGNPLEVLKH